MSHPVSARPDDSFVTRRTNRRQALTAAVAGTLGLATAGAAFAQDATPQAGSLSDTMFLFVQLAERGTWQPSPDDPEVYYLTLTGAGSQTAYFSDRPQRIVGTVDTTRFFDGLGFTPANPPNAAAVVRTPEGERDVLVVELFDPVYTQQFDADGGTTIRYSARVLDAYHGDNLISWYEEQEDPELPSQFDQVSLFIDDCPDMTICMGPKDPSAPWISTPLLNYGPIPGGPYGQCYDWGQAWCFPCSGSVDHYNQLCNDRYPACQGACNGA